MSFLDAAMSDGSEMLPPKTTVERLNRRYSDAYTVASGAVTLGTIIKVAACIIGGLIGFMSLIAGGNTSPKLAFVGILAGALIAGCGFVWGILVTACGQMMQAAIDIAVNSSSLLEPSDKAQILGV